MRWPLVKIGEVCRVIPGFAFKSVDFTTQGIPVVKIANITDSQTVDLSDAEHWPNELFNERLSKFLLQDLDILLAMTGATAGKLGRVRSDQALLLNQRVAKIQPFGASPDFIWFLLSSTKYREKFYSLAGGAAQPNMSGGQIEAVEIPLPSMATQERIGSILSAYDDLIENNRRRMALLDESARQLYREWFVRLRFPGHEHIRVANGVPEGWERARIGDVADCIGGGTPSTSVSHYWEDGKVTWVTPTDVTSNAHFVLLKSEKKITEAGLQNSAAKLLPPHAVLMTSRASVGFFAVSAKGVCTNQGFISIVPHDSILWPYFLFNLSGRVDEIRAMGSGSTYPEVSRGKFRELELLLPKYTLTTTFCEQTMAILKQIRILKQQNENLRAARDLLLPRLVSGEIAV